MELISFLEQRLKGETSMFRAQLAREDIGRLKKLSALATTADSPEEFHKDGLYIGWTKGDFRTHELKDELTALLNEIYASEHGQARGAHGLIQLWQRFETARMEKLVGCL